MDPDKAQPKNQTLLSNRINVLLLSLIALLLVGALWYGFGDRAESPTNQNADQVGQQVSDAPAVSILANTNTLVVNEEHVLEIWADSKDSNVNAIQVDIAYPKDSVEIVSFDYAESAFKIEAQSEAKDGVIKMARAQAGGVTGKQLIGKVRIKATKDSGSAQFEFLDGTMMVRSSDNTDILQEKAGINFSLGASTQ